MNVQSQACFDMGSKRHFVVPEFPSSLADTKNNKFQIFIYFKIKI